MGEAERVDGDRLDRIGDGAAHQRLGGEVQHDLGVGGVDRGGDRLRRAQIAEARIEVVGDAGQPIERRLGLGRQREAGNPSAPSCLSHSAAQAPLKPVWPVNSTRRPRQKSGEGSGGRHAQLFHGARPVAQWLSSRFLSRSVSIGCQKPGWR